jgi:hypothetical protein
MKVVPGNAIAPNQSSHNDEVMGNVSLAMTPEHLVG